MKTRPLEPTTVLSRFWACISCDVVLTEPHEGLLPEAPTMKGRSVDEWMAHAATDEWDVMMEKVAAFHAKHDFAGQNGHADMGYRMALTIEELGELAAAITKGKPLAECAEEMADVLILLMGHSLAMEVDLKAAFVAKIRAHHETRSAARPFGGPSYRIQAGRSDANNPVLEGHGVIVLLGRLNAVKLCEQVKASFFQIGRKGIRSLHGGV